MRTSNAALVLLVCLAAPHSIAQSARPEDATQKLLPPHFMLGVASSPGDSWIDDTKKQGARWDARYQYICGGVNTPSNWKTWNSPAGAFALFYLNDSEKMGCMPCLTYYQMLQSQPGAGKGGEDACNKINCENAGTMKSYFDDFKVLLQKCAEFNKPVILHHEPDLWGFMVISPVFAPNDAEKIKVMVKSSGHEDVSSFDDNAGGFGKALVAMRDKYAPQVMLAWHASKWGNPDIKKYVDFIGKCGKWDLLFTDFSDRDSAWKIAKNYQAGGAWWTDKDFVSYREWSADLHKATRLPIVAWQVPMGNTIMASCNNTDSHYMDNRPEYFLENYPDNKHIAEYAAAGYIGLFFGGGAGGCTSVRDTQKDGITNPEPIANNKGEKATFADDDGGYLRLRGANYYKKGPFVLRGKQPTAPATAEPKKPDVVVPPVPKVDDKLLAEWQAKLIQRAANSIKSGQKPAVFLRLTDKQEKFTLLGIDEKEIRVDVQGNPMPVAWKKVEPRERAALARFKLSDDDVDGLLLVAVMLSAGGDSAGAGEYLAKAALKDAARAEALRVALGMK